MKVLHIASGDGWGGAERVLSILLGAQARMPDLECEALILNEGRLADDLRRSGITVHIVPEEGRSFVSLLRAIRPFLRAADVVHAHRYKEVVASTLLLGPRARRLIITIHGLEPASQLSIGAAIQAWGPLWMARIAGARFAAVSAELGRRVSRVLGAKKVHVITNPAPQPIGQKNSYDLRAKLGWSPDRPVVGFVGRLEEVKGPDLFVKVATTIESDVSFVIVGAGSMESKLRCAVRAEGAEDRVAFIGAVPEAMPLLEQFDALALTSRHEGLPMVLLEAAVLGVPVVAFDVGGVPQVLNGGPAAAVVQQGDITGFARELERVIASRHELDMEIAAWAGPVKEHFGVGRVVEAYNELYRAACTLPPST